MRINVILLNLTMREGSRGIKHRVLRGWRLFYRGEREALVGGKGRERGREGRGFKVTDYVNPVNSSC